MVGIAGSLWGLPDDAIWRMTTATWWARMDAHKLANRVPTEAERRRDRVHGLLTEAEWRQARADLAEDRMRESQGGSP